MTLIVTDVPQTINTLLTEVIAAKSQIPYFITNSDGDVDSIVDSGGKAELHLNASAGDLTSRLIAGEDVFYESDGTTIRTGFYEITSSSFSGGTTRILTTETFISTDTGIVTLKLRDGYHFQITVVDDETSTDINTSPLIYTPSQNGRSGLIDVSNIISNLLSLNFSQSNEFHLRITDSWNGASGQPTVTTDTIQGIFARKQLLKEGGALMWENLLVEATGSFPNGWLNEDDGFNDWTLASGEWSVLAGSGDPVLQTDILRINTFQPIPTGSTIDLDVTIHLPSLIDYNLALWARNDPAGTWVQILAGFTAPTELTFVKNVIVASTGADYNAIGLKLGQRTGSDKTMIIRDIVINSSLPDVIESGKLLTKFENPLIWKDWKRTWNYLFDSEYISRTGGTRATFEQKTYNVNKIEDGNKFASNISEPSDVTVNIVPIDLSIMQNQDPFYLGVQAMLDFDLNGVSESLLYRVEIECKNPIMLDWINSLGGTDQHLFSISNIFENESDEGLIGERAIDQNIETQTLTKFRLTNRETQRITLFAEKLKKDQLLALREIKSSSSVKVYLTKDGTEFISVIVVNDFITSYDSKNSLYDFSLTIEFPANFNFEEGKKY